MKDEKTFNQMKLMKKIITYMQKEFILTPIRAERLRKDIRNWWLIKTKQNAEEESE